MPPSLAGAGCRQSFQRPLLDFCDVVPRLSAGTVDVRGCITFSRRVSPLLSPMPAIKWGMLRNTRTRFCGREMSRNIAHLIAGIGESNGEMNGEKRNHSGWSEMARQYKFLARTVADSVQCLNSSFYSRHYGQCSLTTSVTRLESYTTCSVPLTRGIFTE